LSLFLSLNNYGFNGLLNRIYSWSLRDFIFSLFVKKENKDFSMLQSGSRSVNNSEIISEHFGAEFLNKLDFLLQDKSEIETLRNKFIDYNLNKSLFKNQGLNEITQEHSCINILHNLNKFSEKNDKDVFVILQWAKNKDILINNFNKIYNTFILTLQHNKKQIELQQNNMMSDSIINNAELKYYQNIKEILISEDLDIQRLYIVLTDAFNNPEIRFPHVEKTKELLEHIEKLHWSSLFHQCLQNKLYADFFTAPPR